MFCTNCGTENKADAKFCVNCGNMLKKAAPQTPKAEPAESEAQHVYRTAATTPKAQAPDKKYAQEKQPIVAALLSFVITGVGQLYNGDTKKGLIMLVGAVVLLFVVPFLVLPIWIWSMIDAYQVAEGKKPLWS